MTWRSGEIFRWEHRYRNFMCT